MAIKVSGTTVINDSRELTNITSVDATTVAALGAAGVGGGGGIELTTSEAVVEGDTLAFNFSTGKVEKVFRKGGTDNTQPTIGGYTSNMVYDLIYIPEISKIALMFYTADGANSKARVVLGTQAATGTITWDSSPRELPNFNGNYETGALAWDSNVNRLVAIYRGGNNLYSTTYSASGSTLTQQSAVTIQSGNLSISRSYAPALHFNSTQNKMILMYNQDSSGYLVARVGTITASGQSWTSEQGPSGSNFDNNYPQGFGINSLGSTIVFGYNKTYFYGVAATLSGTTLSFGSAANIGGSFTGSATGRTYLHYLSGSAYSGNMFALIGRSSGNESAAFNFTLSGTTITDYSVDTSVSGSTSYNAVTVYNATDTEGFVAWNSGAYNRADLTTPTLTFGYYSSNNNLRYTGDAPMAAAYNPDVDFYIFGDFGGRIYYWNETVDNYYDFVGVALEAASADSTVKIANAGQIATGLSGLTAGNAYRIQYDGGWQNLGMNDTRSQFNGTQRDRVSGRALTSTTMLMMNDFMSS